MDHETEKLLVKFMWDYYEYTSALVSRDYRDNVMYVCPNEVPLPICNFGMGDMNMNLILHSVF